MRFRWSFSIFFFCLVFAVVLGNKDFFERQKCRHEKLGLAEALEGAERATSYFERYHKSMNIDAIYGLRASQGYLHTILMSVDRRQLGYTSLRLYYKLLRLHSTQEQIGNSAQVYLKRSNPSYYNQLSFVVKKRFSFQRSPRRANFNLLFKFIGPLKQLNESFSDSCLTHLLGTSKNGSAVEKCQISESCLQTMGNGTGAGYFSTHQALFLIIGIQAGCRKILVERFGGESKLELRLDTLGSNIYAQMLENYKNTRTNPDLFLEQTLICYMLGVVDCVRLSWLQTEVSWQDEHGGYGELSWSKPWLVKALGKMKVDYSPRSSPAFRRHTRSLLFDVSLKDGGSAHMSGLGMACMSLYLHWILMPPDYAQLGMKSPFPTTSCPLGTTHKR